jgi:hypothetical protein
MSTEWAALGSIGVSALLTLSGTAEPMARVVVHAAVQATAQDVRLIVSVSGAEDGLPRSGFADTNFDVVSVASDEDTAPRQQLIAQVAEGPAGIYQLVLEGDGQPSTLLAKMVIFAITVSGDTESGWADDRGQTIAVGSTPKPSLAPPPTVLPAAQLVVIDQDTDTVVLRRDE